MNVKFPAGHSPLAPQRHSRQRGHLPIAETIPGFEANASWNFFAPAGTPLDVVAKLNTEFNRILALPEVSERLISQGVIPIGGSPGQPAVRMKSDYAKWDKVVREIGSKPK